MPFTIERTDFRSAESRRLMAELWKEIDASYGNVAPSDPELFGMDRAGAAFVVARENGIAIGCAALRPHSLGVAEVKRVFVQPAARDRGVARAMMGVLEEIARDGGFSEIWLETGLRQPAALRLYENLGYKRIAGFGDYKDDLLSVCFGKSLI